ncbi:hypothetical protein N7535_003198 [Penicillium sp. DV-2018c]|nr:hypothetical protein N7461_001111 [Penicillium sp. DV-2018c]KAJ5576272.1 hypothetical protein N7535_003198 [Penicillium sp. DV-2018c]
MSLPYLKSLLKPQLVNIAEETDLPDYNDYNKTELVNRLEKHLRENREIFSSFKSLADYYSRLDAPPRRGTPVKTATARTPARRNAKKEEVKHEESSSEEAEKEPSPEVVSPTPATTTRTSTRQSPRGIQTPRQIINAIVDTESTTLPASPAIITEAIDAQTVKIRETIDHVWTASGLVDRAHALRANLSSLKAVEILVLLVESGSLAKELVPIRYLTTTPPVQAAQIPPIPIRVPDLFAVLEGTFWAPFSLWLLTCFLLPLAAAYFINLSWQASAGARRTRSAQSPLAQFDPLTFNIVRALMVHVVFVNGFGFFGVYGLSAIRKVVASVPGGISGLQTGSAIGGVAALYEAILHRS